MDNFEKMLHEMFDDIWDCEIDHPLFQDTVGDLMKAVIEAHKRAQLDFDITVKIDKAYDDGYDTGYLQGINDWINDDCISRKMAVEALPSAQPEPHWIPCSERLPENEYVLISKKPTMISGDKWSVAIAVRMADPRSGKIQWRDSGFGVIQDDKVLAWMPMPIPYCGGYGE